MLKFDADQRITAQLALHHRYVAIFDCNNSQTASNSVNYAVTINAFSDSSIHGSQ
jgi:hypothetical protein